MSCPALMPGCSPMSLVPSQRMMTRTPVCCDRVPVEPVQRALPGGPGAVDQQLIPGDARVQHRHPLPRGQPEQAAGQVVGIAVVAVQGGAHAVAGGGAERDDRSGHRRVHDVHPVEEEPGADLMRERGGAGGRAVITGGRVVAGGDRGRMPGGRPGRLLDVDRHGQVPLCADSQLHRIAELPLAGRDRDRVPPAERHAVAAARHHRRSGPAQRDTHVVDRQRLAAEHVGNPEPDLAAADAGAHDVPDGLIPEPGMGQTGRRGRRLRRRPGANPGERCTGRGRRGRPGHDRR